MALPTSGPLSIGDIAAEFGGAVPHSLSEYYGAAAGVPSIGNPISISDFYGTSSIQYATLRPVSPAFDSNINTIDVTHIFTSNFQQTFTFNGYTLTPGRQVSAATLYVDARAVDGVFNSPATTNQSSLYLNTFPGPDARADLDNGTFPDQVRVVRSSVLPFNSGANDDFVYMNSDGADAIAFWGNPIYRFRVSAPGGYTSSNSAFYIYDIRLEITVTGI